MARLPRPTKRRVRGRRVDPARDPLDQNQVDGEASFLWFLDDKSEFPLHLYCEAYRRAAKSLTRSVARLRAPSTERDAGIIPVLFLWRHYLEITLKAIIFDLAYYKEAALPTLNNEHRLGHLWAIAQAGLIEQFALGNGEDKEITRVIESFGTSDPGSTAFRYPTSKQGLRSAPGLRAIDIRWLDRVMTTVSDRLDTIRVGLDSILIEKQAAQAHEADY